MSGNATRNAHSKSPMASNAIRCRGVIEDLHHVMKIADDFRAAGHDVLSCAR